MNNKQQCAYTQISLSHLSISFMVSITLTIVEQVTKRRRRMRPVCACALDIYIYIYIYMAQGTGPSLPDVFNMTLYGFHMILYCFYPFAHAGMPPPCLGQWCQTADQQTTNKPDNQRSNEPTDQQVKKSMKKMPKMDQKSTQDRSTID